MTPHRLRRLPRPALALALAALALAAACTPPAPGRGGFTVSPGRMPAFCAGDAARRFGVDPGDITTGATLRDGEGYFVNGAFQLVSGDSLRFVCRFDADGRFAGTTGR